ncbi:MAG TPA: glycine--tRNA ligase subunit beta [Synergistaceae bacterium]|jgi:glycyl-tRNA synthetase beta chain|nr:glycine--tRNA ligase subunit beta [Synergistaceae bacterium]NLL40547.1 glycine--tRNA ligase subunit beta [Synergistaceae bacterium]HPX02964.1 glycine--tRNA ligase subunit beta [Synergistaceae bacterium]HQA54107.1 glycine--tRNA ligase subunit beta [Synergistaceae bacterium]
MSAKDLLFEIGTEEIPARFMPKALADICQYAGEEFASAHIEHSRIKAECTPRRIVLAVEKLSAAQSDSVEVFKGPLKAQAFDDNGNPTKAAEGFARSKGVSAADLKVKEIGGAEYVVAEKIEKGQATESVLPQILDRIIRRLSFQKSMYWADPSVRFARPVRWIVALYGGSVIKVGFGNVESGNVSRGHRFMGAGSVVINDPSEYKRLMKENFVITDPEERKEMILAGIASVEKELGAKVEVDPDLLEENVHLNEYPVVFYGSFDKEFLEIPEEVLVLSMAKNQRYFPVRDKDGRLMANFVGVSNNIAKDMNVVREGNERVLRARLYDAAFFWKEDLQKSLDDLAAELRSVTYQEQLGSVYDKVQRTKKLALWLTEALSFGEWRPAVERAADIAKADLVTSMVYEFADVQGVMGREYARKAGEPEDVAMALYEQYLPRFAGDSIPSAPAGALIGIADRADTLAAIYKIGLEPTSSQDPYGLRRAARCINEIIWGFPLDIDIYLLLEKAASPFSIDKETLDRIRSFVRQRLQVQLREKGFRHEVVELVLQTISNRPLQAYRMAETLQKRSDEVWFTDLITAAVRVKNILNKAGSVPGEVDPSLLVEGAEKELYEKLLILEEEVTSAVDRCDWEKLASVLAELAPVIAGFFNDVLVMDENLSVRNNRLALLGKCSDFFLMVGDFSLLK